MSAALALALALAASAPTTGAEADRIQIVSELDSEAAGRLAPGSEVAWYVDVSTTSGEPGTVDISLAETGRLGLEVAVYRCGTAWDGEACAAGETRVRELSPLREGQAGLLSMPDTESAHLRMVVVAPDDVPESARGTLRLIASGAGGEREAEGPHSPLEPTGGLSLWALACAAAGVLGAGAAITVARAVRRRR